MALVYVPMAIRTGIHHGHINILNHARKLADQGQPGEGIVIVGLVTDERITEYKGPPLLDYDARYSIIQSLRQVDIISKCDDLPLFYHDIDTIQPRYVVHGSDWAEVDHPLFMTRQKILGIIGEWNGYLSELTYTEGISCTKIMEEKYLEQNQDYGVYSGSYTSG